jgi:hypothetical protein
MTDPKGNTTEFGFMPNMDEMSLGEYIDLEKYISNWDTMHKAMAILYRPIVAGKKEFYEIEKYEGSDKYSDLMKDSPITVSLGAMVFFYHLGKELLTIITRSLQEELVQMVHQTPKNLSGKNGDGTNRYMLLLEEMSENLSQLRNLTSISV